MRSEVKKSGESISHPPRKSYSHFVFSFSVKFKEEILNDFICIENWENYRTQLIPKAAREARMAERAGSFLQGLQKKRLALWE